MSGVHDHALLMISLYIIIKGAQNMIRVQQPSSDLYIVSSKWSNYPYQRVSSLLHHLAVLFPWPDVLVQTELQAQHYHYNTVIIAKQLKLELSKVSQLVDDWARCMCSYSIPPKSLSPMYPWLVWHDILLPLLQWPHKKRIAGHNKRKD